MNPSLPASCWPLCPDSRSGPHRRCRCPILGASSAAARRTAASYSQLDGRSTASVIEPSVPGVHVHGSGAWATGTHDCFAGVRHRREARRPPRDPSKWLAGTKESDVASSMTPARARGGWACAWSTVSVMVLSSRLGGGWGQGPAGRTHASAGPLCQAGMGDLGAEPPVM
jgi:hypothetical protein